jgi:hypothetical protein
VSSLEEVLTDFGAKVFLFLKVYEFRAHCANSVHCPSHPLSRTEKG